MHFGGDKGRSFVRVGIYFVCFVKVDLDFLYFSSPWGFRPTFTHSIGSFGNLLCKLKKKGVKCCILYCWLLYVYAWLLPGWYWFSKLSGWSLRDLGWEVSSPWFKGLLYRFSKSICDEEKLGRFSFSVEDMKMIHLRKFVKVM